MFLPRSEFQPLHRIIAQQIRAAADYRNIRIYIVQFVIPRDIELLIVFRQLAVCQDVKAVPGGNYSRHISEGFRRGGFKSVTVNGQNVAAAAVLQQQRPGICATLLINVVCAEISPESLSRSSAPPAVTTNIPSFVYSSENTMCSPA